MNNSTSIQELQESEENENIQKNNIENIGSQLETVKEEGDYNSFIIKPPPK